MEFLIGFAGALASVLLLGGGFFFGWHCKGRAMKYKPVVTDAAGETERKRLIEQQKAFNALQNYSPETAYGMTRNALTEKDE